MIFEVNKKDKQIVWKDKRLLEIVSTILIFLALCFFIWATLVGNYNILGKISGLLIVGFFLYYFIVQLRKRHTYVTNKGIMMGNINPQNRYKFFPQKCIFYEWDKIKLLQIKSKGYYSYKGGRTFNYLTLNTKTKIVHECILYDAEGFIQIIKKINKSKLLSLESRIYK